jgi:hypothetical protein
LRSKWAAGKAVRAGLAVGRRIQAHFFAPEDRQNKREMKKVGLDVTDEQRRRRPIFIATLWAAASWLFFRVARSSRIDSDMLVVTASPARTALKNSQLTCGERHAISGTGHQLLNGDRRLE